LSFPESRSHHSGRQRSTRRFLLPLIAKYGGELLLRRRATSASVVAAEIEVPYEIHVVPFGREEDFTRFLSGRGAAAGPSPEERVGARFDSGAGMLVRSRRRYPARALVENQPHSTLEAGREVARVVERFCRPVAGGGPFVHRICSRPGSSTRQWPEKWTPAHASKAMKANQLPEWLSAKRTAAFWSSHWTSDRRACAADFRGLAGTISGTIGLQERSRNSKPVVYLGFSSR